MCCFFGHPLSYHLTTQLISNCASNDTPSSSLLISRISESVSEAVVLLGWNGDALGSSSLARLLVSTAKIQFTMRKM